MWGRFPLLAYSFRLGRGKDLHTGFPSKNIGQGDHATTPGRGSRVAGSNEIGEVAWYNVNSQSSTHIVGTKKPNELGIYDMSGNVFEWCQDYYSTYTETPKTDPLVSEATAYGHVSRGFSYAQDHTYPVTARGYTNPAGSDTGSSEHGFRLVLEEAGE